MLQKLPVNNFEWIKDTSQFNEDFIKKYNEESDEGHFQRKHYKARLLANAFIDSQFNYVFLIWMFAGKTLIDKIYKIHHRTKQVVYDDFNKSYDELLEQNKDLSIHQRHLRYLAIEVFKSIMHLNPQFMWSYFEEKPMPYNLRYDTKLVLPKIKSSRFGFNSLQFRGSLLWNNLPVSVKNCKSLNIFKLELKTLGNINCICIVCR